MSTKAQNLVAAASLLADQAAPYFRESRAAMPIIFTENIPAVMGVDKHWRCYCNPAIVSQFTPPEIGYILLHELCHCLRQHADRCAAGGREPEKWNISADFEINGLDWPGLKHPPLNGKQFGIKASDKDRGPKFGYIPANLPEGLLAEEYYCKIPDPPKSPSANRGGGKPDDKGGTPGGSCADGQGRPWELPGDDAKNPGLTDLEQMAKRMETAGRIQQHASKERGSIPGGWERWAETILKPV